MPEVTSVANKELRLNGMGVRKEWLCLKSTSSHSTSNYRRRTRRQQLRPIRKSTLSSACCAISVASSSFRRWKRLLCATPARTCQILRSRLDLLENALPAPKKGDVLSFTYLPGIGTRMRGPGQEMTIPGNDFADAVLSVWLGPTPIGGALKRQLLAG